MTDVIPDALAAGLTGEWTLGPAYHIELTRSGGGLRVHQEAQARLRAPSARDDEAGYDQVEGTITFPGIGAIHRTEVVMRLTGERVEFRIRTEISPGRWTEGAWEAGQRPAAAEG